MVAVILLSCARSRRRGHVRHAGRGRAPVRSRIASTAHAEEDGLRTDWRVDGAVTAAAFVFWGGTQLFESRLAPADCRWCDPGSLDASVRERSPLGRHRRRQSGEQSGRLPLCSAHQPRSAGARRASERDRLGELPGDGLVIAEAVALNGALTQIVKFAVGRERPFVHALPADQKPLTAHPADNNVSFYSSHTSFAFSLAVSTGTVASMRAYRWAPLIWAVGLAGAADGRLPAHRRRPALLHRRAGGGGGRIGDRVRRPSWVSSPGGRARRQSGSRAAAPC